ncbi:carbonic anhydrase [Halobacterium zhouii]|uniref:carbonic anhydrase n=1 Tax=Halobacterium zhouii TaxID=2902624 RepID=UPI001E2B8D3F|nr:carbonic anhydrase [Halobacterium zhouii]
MRQTLVELLENNREHADAFHSRFDDVQESQHPDAVTVCCSDSRVLQDAMWGNDVPGRIFTCGNIGNRVVQRVPDGDGGTRDVVSGDVLYPLAHTGTDTAVVVGHTGCGAVTATYDAIDDGADEPAGIAHCVDLLRTRLEPGVDALPDGLGHDAAVNHLVEYNVDRQVEFLLESEDVPDDVSVAGVVYDFQDVYGGQRGEVHVVNVDGETDGETLRDDYPEIDSRIERLWEY